MFLGHWNVMAHVSGLWALFWTSKAKAYSKHGLRITYQAFCPRRKVRKLITILVLQSKNRLDDSHMQRYTFERDWIKSWVLRVRKFVRQSFDLACWCGSVFFAINKLFFFLLESSHKANLKINGCNWLRYKHTLLSPLIIQYLLVGGGMVWEGKIVEI